MIPASSQQLITQAKGRSRVTDREDNVFNNLTFSEHFDQCYLSWENFPQQRDCSPVTTVRPAETTALCDMSQNRILDATLI